MKRFRVAEHSMLPALSPGDEFVATGTLPPTPGAVVAFPEPGRDDFWLVKRVMAKPGIGPGQIWVESDNGSVPSFDSRSFGPIDAGSALVRVERLDAATFVEAANLLAGEDEALANLIAENGMPAFWSRPPGFATLVLLILEQQVSLESGAAVFARLREECGEVTPESVSAVGHGKLRAVGLTRQKAEYVTGLAHNVIEGDLQLTELEKMAPDDARSTLVGIRGIGLWTADAYLLSALRFPDVFPVGDRALQVGVAEALGLAHTPGPVDLEMLSMGWRPLRSVAARLIWHGYLTRRGRTEPDIRLPGARRVDS